MNLKAPNLNVFALAALALALPSSPARAAMNWMPITDEDRAATASTIEPGAGAEILYRFKQVNDGKIGSASTDEYMRVKIYTEAGAQALAKIDIPYDDKTETIKDLAACVIKPDGTEINVDKKAFYDREVVKFAGLRLHVRSFALPALEPGAILEYKWTVIKNTNVYYLKIDLASDMPTRRLVFRVKPVPIPGYSTDVYFNKCAHTKPVQSKDGFSAVEMHDLPSVHDEPFMPPADDARPWLMFYPFRDFGGNNWTFLAKQISDPLEKRLAKTSDAIRDLAVKIASTPSMPELRGALESPRKQNEPDATFNKAVDLLINSGDSTRELRAALAAPALATPAKKFARLCDYCRANIANIDYYTPQGGVDPKLRAKQNRTADEIIQTKVATSADLQFLLIALARAAGFDARAAFCSNRSTGAFRKNLYFPLFLPDPIVAVKFGGAWKYYDPAHCLVPSGKLRWQNSPATTLILKSGGIEWGTTPPPAPEDSLVHRTGAFRLTEDGALFGHVSISYGDIAGADARADFFTQSQDAIEKLIRDRVQARIPLAEISNVQADNSNNPFAPFTLSYEVTIPGYAEITGQRYFAQPNFFEKGKPAMFTADTRAADVVFNYPINEKDEVTITIPPWLKIEEGSAPADYEKEKVDWGEYRVRISLNKRTSELSYTRAFEFTIFNIAAAGYPRLKSLLNTIHERDAHTLTLRASGADISH